MMDESERPIAGRDSGADNRQQGASDRPEPGASPTDQVLPESYRSCLDAIPDMMALKGEELEYLFVNRAFCKILEKPQEEILGKRATDVFPKKVAKKLETMDLLVLASLEKSTEEVVIGDRVYEMRKFPVNLHDRGLVVVTGRDITERKESEAVLLTEKIRFQIISDNAPVAMILFDDQGNMKYANARFREIFGYDTDDIPDGATWFRHAFPDREYETVVASVVSRPDEVSGWKGRERSVLTAIRRNGTRLPVSLEATQLTSGDVVVSCDDLTEHLKDESRTILESDYESLTGLPNRSSLERAARIAVARARENRKRRALSAILFLAINDFDGLKSTHDVESIDEVLTTLARLLKSILREGDVAYSLSEDRFAVLFKGISVAEARLASERIYNSLRSFTFLAGSRSLVLTIIVVLVPVEGTQEAPALLTIGEKLVEEAKMPDFNRILVYEPEQTGS